jgi:hypothetical protein
MLHALSSPPSEARSPPPARRRYSQKMLQDVPCSYTYSLAVTRRIPLYLIFKRGRFGQVNAAEMPLDE